MADNPLRMGEAEAQGFPRVTASGITVWEGWGAAGQTRDQILHSHVFKTLEFFNKARCYR
jgi:hypothetical protein